ncbi:MAG: hypothetical protein WDM80_18675 [Limisphaerales bacterium]
MKIQIDLKSAACGLVVGVATMFVLGANSSPSMPVGRYQIATGQNSSVIVDTTNGKAWAFQPLSTVDFRKDGNFWDQK